jgi:thiosulfate/3-mercaptopyruvate sulfurtransferase
LHVSIPSFCSGPNSVNCPRRDEMFKTMTTKAAVVLVGAAMITPALRGFEAGDALRLREEMLVSTAWLAEHLTDRDLVILYVGRDRGQFDAGHISGSRFALLDDLVEQHKNSLNELPPAGDLQAVFESLGVGDGSRVVLMGDGGGMLAARAYFTLDYLGHGDHAALLDGGLEKWVAEVRPVSHDESHAPRAHLTPHIQARVVVSTQTMRQFSRQAGDSPASTHVLLDARPVAEFEGVVNSEAVPAAGHIPGAYSLYWKKLLRSEAMPALLDPADLEQVFQRAGVRRGQTIVTYCRTGMQSSFTYFVAKYLGYSVAMYDGSVYEWVNGDGNELVLSPVHPGAANR